MKLNSTKNIIIGILLLATEQLGLTQGFINLAFESAKIIPINDSPQYPYGIATTNALPGWTVYLGGNPTAAITYNDPTVGSTWASLVASNAPYMSPISGKYSVLLQGGLSLPSATISQTGLVPVGTESLLFEAQQNGVGTLQVLLGGQNLTFFAIVGGLNYTLYGVAASAFAGQVETLSFSALQVSSYVNDWNIDNIQFSSTPVPEPGILSLSALGGVLFGLRRRKRTSR